MNFIASSILYHAEEYLTFWLLVMIFEMFEMRDIYLPSKPIYLNQSNFFLLRAARFIKTLSNY